MKRDFMGLTVKQEILEEPATDPAVARSSAMQWSFSNKGHPQYLSFKGTTSQENNNKPKTGFESLASAGLVTITTTTEPVDAIHRTYCTSVTQVQKNAMLEMQSRTNYTMTSHPPHQISSQYSVANQTHHQGNFISTINPNPARAAQIPSPISTHVPTLSGIVGTTELRDAPRTSPGPAQLTIFYGGSVCVYDNISPEKAQAIMLLAGNAPPVTPSTTSTASPIQTIPKSPSVDAFVNVNKFHGTSPSFSSPSPINSRGTSKSVGVFNNTNETTIIRSAGVLKSPSNTTEPSNVVSSQEFRPPSHSLSAVPQARKASLARFLEKRKERVVSASPYDNSKQTSQYKTTPVSGNWIFTVNSSGSSPLPATN
ncbi:protein TIFY 6B-like isoform X2 [Lycium barbarum]|uniref:protein TIFY 6B-like isoform X2 n=1 Tax=Lycium barbarum TaxID=112863 RepID=UPI00293F7132|nr:protein TIFY 6B-like isoform X2 [Lycium barbarum]